MRKSFLSLTLLGAMLVLPLTVIAEHCSNTEPVFTHCANQYGTGNPKNCVFDGLREVRFGNENGWKTRKYYGSLQAYKCRAENFDGGPLGAGPYRCEYSSEFDTVKVAPPADCSSRHDCMGFDMNMPIGAPAHTTARLVNPALSTKAENSDIGSFRTNCEFTKFSYDDPLLFPGQPGASHLHMYSGNDSVNAMSDTTNLANVGGSSCSGGILNRSAYWTPAVIDMSTKTPQLPVSSLWYYKEGYYGLSGTGFGSLPEGLGMIGTDHHWACTDTVGKYETIPSCPAGETLTMVVAFPQCWDGVNKWLSDKSHVAYPSRGSCPLTHPVSLPQITLNIRYKMKYAGQSENLMLSSDMDMSARGSTGHADWVNGWDKATSDKWINNCLNTQSDCHAELLGDGTALY